MPALDSITIQPSEMVDILERLRQLQHDGPIKIIDTVNSFTVRDKNEMFLVDVMKKEPEYANA